MDMRAKFSGKLQMSPSPLIPNMTVGSLNYQIGMITPLVCSGCNLGIRSTIEVTVHFRFVNKVFFDALPF